jgi:hypothetical protein
MLLTTRHEQHSMLKKQPLSKQLRRELKLR